MLNSLLQSAREGRIYIYVSTKRRNIYKQHTKIVSTPCGKRYLAPAECLSMGPLTGHPVYTKDNFFLSLAADSKQTVLIIRITYKSRNTFFPLHKRGVFCLLLQSASYYLFLICIVSDDRKSKLITVRQFVFIKKEGYCGLDQE